MEITILQEKQVLRLLVELFLLLFFARGLGELFRRFGQPAVVGEIIGGILLGPTVLGAFWPELQRAIFPTGDAIQMHMLEVFSWLGALFLLMVAGMEVDLSVVRKQGRSAFLIAVSRIIVSFGLGFALGMVLPSAYIPADVPPAVFASFLGVACAVCAVPVLAKILYELGMLKSDIGLLTLSSSTLSDFLCWIIFTMIIGVATGAGFKVEQAMLTIGSTIIFVTLVMTVGRAAINRIVKHVEENTAWQSGSVMVFAFLLAMGLAIVCQMIHIHAVFGFFLAGILIGDCPHVSSQVRESISAFVMSLFSPLFFASIGLKVNFFTHFDLGLLLAVFGVIVVGKFLGVLFGGRLSGMSYRDTMPVASGMLAGGAMEIIIALIGLQHNLIHQDMFVALVIVAVVTSVVAGPLMAWSVKTKAALELAVIVPSGGIIPGLVGEDICQVVTGMVGRLGPAIHPYTPQEVVDAVLAREAMGSTAMGDQIAVPHARLAKLKKPVLAMGRVDSGLMMDSPDGQDVHLVFLILTPAEDMGMQVQILAGIAGTLQDAELRHQLLNLPDHQMQSKLMQALQGKKLTKKVYSS